MWTVIYITSIEQTAEKIKEQLSSEGFLIKVRYSKSLKQYEILVLKGELEEVKEILSTILS